MELVVGHSFSNKQDKIGCLWLPSKMQMTITKIIHMSVFWSAPTVVKVWLDFIYKTSHVHPNLLPKKYSTRHVTSACGRQWRKSQEVAITISIAHPYQKYPLNMLCQSNEKISFMQRVTSWTGLGKESGVHFMTISQWGWTIYWIDLIN